LLQHIWGKFNDEENITKVQQVSAVTSEAEKSTNEEEPSKEWKQSTSYSVILSPQSPLL
jgi:hypothetical protein